MGRSYESVVVYFPLDGKNYKVAEIPLRRSFIQVFHLGCGYMTFYSDHGNSYELDERATVGALIKFLKRLRKQNLEGHPRRMPKWISREVAYLDEHVMPMLKILDKSLRVYM